MIVYQVQPTYRDTANAATALSVYDQIKLLRLLANELSGFDSVSLIDDAASEIEREMLEDNARVNGQPADIANTYAWKGGK